MITAQTGLRRFRQQPIQFSQAIFQLLIIRFKRLALGLKIGALSLKCRVFGLNQRQLLAEDRRRAVLVDQFFKMLKQTHKTSL